MASGSNTNLRHSNLLSVHLALGVQPHLNNSTGVRGLRVSIQPFDVMLLQAAASSIQLHTCSLTAPVLIVFEELTMKAPSYV